jgi:hypothetical protein
MLKHATGLVAAALVVVACMLLPFLPGQYDALAVTLSALAQIIGVVGLVLVPIGAVWLVYERGSNANKPRVGFAIAALAAATLVAAVAALAGFATMGPSMGLVVLALWAYFAGRFVAHLKGMRVAQARRFNPAPLYLIVVPLVACAAKFILVGPASERSRNRAIANSARLIADIERYRDANGHYPRSLLSLWQDYRPGVIGVQRYHYEPSGEAYNVCFEHFAGPVGTREIVMFNKLGQQEMTSHDMDLLQFTGQALARRRGHYAVRDAATPNWKYFWFD